MLPESIIWPLALGDFVATEWELLIGANPDEDMALLTAMMATRDHFGTRIFIGASNL